MFTWNGNAPYWVGSQHSFRNMATTSMAQHSQLKAAIWSSIKPNMDNLYYSMDT